MKFGFRRLRKGEIDHELLWGSVLASSAMIGGAWIYLNLPRPVCLLKDITGIPCPTCGMTRSAQGFMAGDLSAAFGWNPLVFLAVPLLMIFCIYAAITVCFRLPRLRVTGVTRGEAMALRVGVVVLIAANWAYLIWHFSAL